MFEEGGREVKGVSLRRKGGREGGEGCVFEEAGQYCSPHI